MPADLLIALDPVQLYAGSSYSEQFQRPCALWSVVLSPGRALSFLSSLRSGFVSSLECFNFTNREIYNMVTSSFLAFSVKAYTTVNSEKDNLLSVHSMEKLSKLLCLSITHAKAPYQYLVLRMVPQWTEFIAAQ
jgi:hypothetical protein